MQVDQARELEELRARVQSLEAERASAPAAQRVEVEGFDGLRQLSTAIEQNKLDIFLLNKGTPDWWFWGMIALFGVILAAMGISAFYNYAVWS